MDSHLNEVAPGLFVGNWTSSTHPEKLYELGIRGVITVETQTHHHTVTDKYAELGICHAQYRLGDLPTEDISQYFDHSYKFIQRHLKRGEKVLVNCWVGVSRSATIAANYIIRSMYTLNDMSGTDYLVSTFMTDLVITMMRKSRPQINPNFGFVQQLERAARQYAKELYPSSSGGYGTHST